ncbi:MAG: ATP-binding protein [Thermoanaerobaculia bacterium]|jgi:hypothetical protein
MGRAEDLFAELKREGEPAVDRMIVDHQSENLWLDFKRAAADGDGTKFGDSDWKNLSRAISGFGNSDGGVIVWGVDCRPDPLVGDVPTKKIPVVNPRRFVSWIEGAISACTMPPHESVENFALEIGSNEGFVVSLIPASSLAPIQVLKPANSLQYLIRSGSSFVPTPHAVLAGLFGRRPHPRVFHQYEATAKVLRVDGKTRLGIDVWIHAFNAGKTVAQFVFANLLVRAPAGGSDINVVPDPKRTKNWLVNRELHSFFSCVSNESYRLAPQSFVTVMRCHLNLAPPFKSPYGYRLQTGCDGSPVEVVTVEMDPDILQETFEAAVKWLDEGHSEASDEILRLFVGAVR